MAYEDVRGFTVTVTVRSKGTNRTFTINEDNAYRENIPCVAQFLGKGIQAEFIKEKDDGYIFSEHNKGKWITEPVELKEKESE